MIMAMFLGIKQLAPVFVSRKGAGDLGLGQVLLEGGVQARALQRQQLAHERHVRAHRRRLLLLALPQVRIQALRMQNMSNV